MRRLKTTILAAVLAVFMVLPAFSIAPAKSADADKNSFYRLSSSTATLQGVYGSQEFYFTVDQYWDVKTVTLHLDISQSQRIDASNISSITISLNGTPVKSLPLKDYMRDHSTIDFSFNLSAVKVGANDVKIQVYRRITDLPCADDVSVANWVNINPSSGVNVLYADKSPTMNISLFPYPFYKTQSNMNLDTAVTVADNADDSMLASAMELDSAFGRYADASDLSLKTSRLGDLSANDRRNKNIIYIGNSDSAPKSLLSYFPAGTNFASGAAIKLIWSPYSSGCVMLLVLAKNDSDIERAVKFLENDSLVRQVQGSFFLLNHQLNVSTQDAAPTNTYSFTDLGYNGAYVYGCFRKTVSIALRLPENKTLSEASSITLQFRYSKNLDFDKSLATIYINDIPIGSKRLTEATANDDTLTLPIPPEARSGNYFNIKIALDLEMKNVWCTFRQEENPWAYIKGSSSLYLPTMQVSPNLFRSSPSPFVEDNRWNNALFVFPSAVSSANLDEAGKIAVYMGHSVKSNHGAVGVTTDYKTSPALAGANLIVIGTPNSQPIIKENNSALFFKYDNAFKYFLPNDKLMLIPEYSRTLTSFQLLDSPYNKRAAMLTITAPDGDNLLNAIAAVFQPSKFSLNGDGVLVDTNGKILDYRFKKDVATTPAFWMSNTSNLNLFISIILSVLILLGITLILILRKNRKFEVRHDDNPRKNRKQS